MKRIIRRNKTIYLALFLFMTIGFAYLTRTLGNSGNNFLKSNEWDIHFENIKPLSYSIEATSPATIDNTGLNIDFSATFNEPGEKYAFYVDVVNDGTIPGMIELITKTGIPEQYSNVVSMHVLNLDESEVKAHQLIDNGDSTKLLVIVTYDDDISEDDLLPTDLSLNLGVSIEVVQADENAVVGPMNLYKTVAFNWKQAGSIDATQGGARVGGLGIFRFTSTKNDNFPVYYYSRNIEGIIDNNVIFGGFCWRIIRTTSTGGVKLLYNGTPSNNQCIGFNAGFDYDYYNYFNINLESHGYMYGDSTLNPRVLVADSYSGYIGRSFETESYYFAKSVNKSNGIFSLVNPVLLDASSSSSILDEYKYTFFSTSSSTTGTAYYQVRSIDNNTLYAYNPRTTVTYYYGDTIAKDGNGRYYIVSPSYFSSSNWDLNYQGLVGKYLLSSAAYSSIIYVGTSTMTIASGVNASYSYTYAGSYEYENGMYTLTGDTLRISNWSNRSQLHNKHYFCLNLGTTCEELGYIYEANDSYMYYITLKNGHNLEEAMDDLYAPVNNSMSKNYIDTWYVNNLISYEKYIEDTPYCNDTKIISNNFNPNGGAINLNTRFNYCNRMNNQNYTLTCEKKYAYTVNESDTGNGYLDYPIGLMTGDEMQLAGGTDDNYSYIYTGSSRFWSMTPYLKQYNQENYYFNILQHSSSTSIYSFVYGSAYNRPVVSVNDKLIVVGGDGNEATPYRLFYLD